MEAPSEKSHHSVGPWKQKSRILSVAAVPFPKLCEKTAKSNGAKLSTKVLGFLSCFSCCFNSKSQKTDL